MPTPTCTPRTSTGAPFALAANRPLSAPAESAPPSAVQADAAARCRGPLWRFFIRRGAAAARRRRGRPGQLLVTLRCAAQPKPKPAAAARVQDDAEARSGTLWGARSIRGWGEGGALRPPPHRPRPPPLPRAPSLPELLVPSDVPSVLADPAGREATAHTALCNERPRRAPRRAQSHRRVEV
jgi:hypothetical protein